MTAVDWAIKSQHTHAYITDRMQCSNFRIITAFFQCPHVLDFYGSFVFFLQVNKSSVDALRASATSLQSDMGEKVGYYFQKFTL